MKYTSKGLPVVSKETLESIYGRYKDRGSESNEPENLFGGINV